MNTARLFATACATFAALPLLAQAAPSEHRAAPSVQTQPVHQTKERDGNEVFLQNCSRCHSAPETFSPRISGTVIRHMRVRAGLSKEDEQAVLKFLNQ